MPDLENSAAPEERNGFEGEAAQRYFSVFDSMILQQRDGFAFHGRSRRLPLDAVNALLSFAYALLARTLRGDLDVYPPFFWK